ncbi:MAG: Na+/H+ antiporter subunit E [Rhodospirillales bacterium]|nr:Na+/H+ antiporter subunit E [Rhodospirillales bacterium]
MNLFLLNLVLALVWGAVTGSFAPGNLIFGFILGFLSLWLVRDRVDRRNFYRPARVALLIWEFLKELCLSSVRVARDTLSPRMTFQPSTIAVPLHLRQDAEIMLLANLISLTPGTLSVDVSSDRSTLYIHAMDVDDPDELCREIKDGFENLIRNAME